MCVLVRIRRHWRTITVDNFLIPTEQQQQQQQSFLQWSNLSFFPWFSIFAAKINLLWTHHTDHYECEAYSQYSSSAEVNLPVNT